MSEPNNPHGLRNEYWNSLSEKSRQIYDNVRPLRSAAYTVQNPIARIEATLETLDQDARSQGGELNLCPDFQRGHVWSQDKQIAFIEAVLRGTAPLNIRFNAPSWNSKNKNDVVGLNPEDILCVDGLQRLTAMREFMAGKFKIFGQYSVDDLDETPFTFKRIGRNWTMEVYDISTREELLQFYLDLNAGGVVHTPEELERVGKLLEESREQTSKPTKPARKKSSPKN